MKKAAILLFLSLSLYSNAQEIKYTSFIRIKTVDSLTKAMIYDKIKLWGVSAFQKVAGAKQLDDKDAGLIAYDATTTLKDSAMAVKYPGNRPLLTTYTYNFKITVQVKDGKYRVEANDIKVQTAAGKYTLYDDSKAPYKYMFGTQKAADKEWLSTKQTFSQFINELLNTLDAEVIKKSDW